MTRIEMEKRNFINLGINIYKTMLENPSVKLHRAGGVWYGISKGDLSLICGKEGDIGQSTGDFYRLGKSVAADKELSIGQLELGKKYMSTDKMLGGCIYSLDKKRRLMGNNGGTDTTSALGYNNVIEMKFLEVKDE